MYDLKGKVALVTGAGGEYGIGRAIATRLAEDGADVVVNDIAANPHAHRHGSAWAGVPDTVRRIEDLGQRALGVLADITDSAQVDDMVRQALDRFGHIDILVNNAGMRHGADLANVVDLEEEAWDDMQRVNVNGTFLCSRAVAREMIPRGQGGKIIVISSLAGKRGLAGRAAYCASKFALIGFTQCLALELAPHRICVNAICPGMADTERMDHLAAVLAPAGVSAEEYRTRYVEEWASRVPLGRVAQATDIARMAAFLASSESDYITGLSVSVSGGSLID